ncbi:helicase associated domain-containing protein [Streptacidiphilus sp. EB129]|uniref:helicase associated domain-containing protein n=1 Tax=Streptacidiphilus sp. EB129 TaxID=3156262 RepID=UPI003518C3CB
MCEHVLGLQPLAPEVRPKATVTWAEKERRNLAAAAQFRAREGHLNVPRGYKETIVLDDVDGGGDGDGSGTEVILSLPFCASSKRRKGEIPAERADRLTDGQP